MNSVPFAVQIIYRDKFAAFCCQFLIIEQIQIPDQSLHVNYINRSLGQATPCITAFAEGQAAAYRMFETIKRKPDIDASDTTGIVLKDIKGDLELKDVYFSYPTRPDHLIFNGFSLKVSSGMTMAIVGESGSGKSTVINLVER